MTTNKFMKLITLAFGMAASVCSFAATGADGDIFDIRPCDAEGNAIEAYASIEKPITVGGKPLYFKVALETRDFAPDAKPWMLKHVGVSSELLDDALFPLQIGIFVSGQLEYADLVDVKTVDQGTLRARTEFIFKYVSRTGDVALPIVLAAETTDGIKPATDDTSDSFSYVLNRTDKWAITTDEDTPKTPKLFFANDVQTAQIGIGGRVIDYTLAKCGFYIQTICFDSNWEIPEGEPGAVWRSVHESSSITGGNTAPMLEALAAPDHAVTLYVWSTDDDVVSVKGGTGVEMIIGYENGNPITKNVKVGEITFGSGQMTADFQIEGAAGGEGKSCDLVLSPWAGYNYNVSNVRLTDYVTVPVKCLEPLPPTVVVSVDRDKAYAKVGDGWKEYSAIVDVALTQPVATPIDVTVTPSIVGYDGDMSEYVRFSTSATSVKTIAALSNTATVTIPAGQLRASAKVYAFFLRADERTSGGATLDFTPSIPADQQTATGLTAADRFVASGCEVVAEAPRFDSPLDDSEIGATAGVAQELEIELADTYAAQQIKSPANGYKVEIKYNDSLGWKDLSGAYYIGTGGLLRTADGKLPELVYPTSSASTSTGTFTTQIRVTDPINGTRVILRLVATVAAPKTVMVTTEADTFNEGDTVRFKIQLNADNDTGAPLYAFLVAGPDDTKAGHFSALGRKCVITPDMTAQNHLLTKGIVINPDNGGPGKEAVASVKLLDGLSEDIGGSSYYFTVVLCSTETYNPDTVVSGYNSNYATIQVFNVEPTITRIEMNKYEPVENGGLLKFDGAYPIGQTQKFQAIVKDLGGFDLTDGFTTRWTITRVGGGISIPVTELVGNPNEEEHSVTFNQAGTYKVKVQIKDKDMDDWSAIFAEVYVDVVDQPQLVVEDVQDLSEEPDSEMAKRRKVSVSLGGYYNAAEEMVVMVSVIPPEGDNAGIFELDAAYESIPQRYETLAQNAIAADGTLGCKHYFLKFRGTESQEISVTKMDGTMLTMSPGFSVKAQVLNTGASSDPAKSWAEYYLSQTTRFYINNIAPVAVVTDQNNESNRWEVAGGAATQYPIRWTVRNDVDNDYTGLWSDGQTVGIKVSFAGCDNADDGLTYVTSRTSGTSGVFIPNFGSVQGDQTVTMTIEDKDGGYTTYSYLYKVTPSKFLTTISTGPSGGTTTSKLSQKYALLGSNIYGTLGQGHTYVGSGASFSSANNFRLRWNCSKKTAVEIFAYGYKVNDPVDDGDLDDGNDVAITATGRAQAGVAIPQGECYRYPFADAAKDTDKKDSFFYCWILHTVDENGGSADSILGGTISPEVPGAPGTGRVNLPNEQTKDGNYLDTEVEAIFAREWLTTDNLGDINADGIPDVFAMKTWGGGNLIKLVTGAEEIIDNDLVNLSSSNPDEDFLPAVYGGKGNSYAPIGLPFTTRMEIRGFGDGLNAQDMTASDPDFTVIDGDPNPPDEQEAWEKFAEANGLDPVADKNLANWTPEPGTDRYPRMDPTVEDTDGDGFPDGWEYYFWYQAHINKRAQENSVSFERFVPTRILQGEAIDLEDVVARFNPCAPLEPDVLAKNPDFDGDGLSDLEELAIGTNPCHWDTDGDHMCDGWEVMMCLDPLNGSDKSSNPDGDFMAYFRLSRGFTPADADHNAAAPDGFKVYLNIPEEIVQMDVQTGALGADGEPTFVIVRTLSEAVQNARFVRVGVKYDAAGEIVRYGLEGDIVTGPEVPADAIWGHVMVDIIEVGVEDLAEGTEVARISSGNDRILIHDQVREVFGYDPRTAWSNVNGYVADRWNPVINTALQPDDTTGAAVNTRPYYTYDEYLVMKYRSDFGIIYYDNDGAFEGDAWDLIRGKTTNPNVVHPTFKDDADGNADADADADADAGAAGAPADDGKSPAQEIAEKLQEAFKQAGSNRGPVTTHGADTDLDGVPDGWELYVGRNPNAAPVVPGPEDGEGMPGELDYDADGLSYALEYAGTDSCNAYEGCDSIYRNHPGNTMGWFNKFFPTNPGINAGFPGEHMGTGVIPGADTDLDGVLDGEEGGNWAHDFYNGGNTYPNLLLGFIYGAPADDASCCIRGAGMNPCTIDTDLDGIPDGWEMQHAGIPVDAATGAAVNPLNNGRVGSAEVDEFTLVADGIFARLAGAAAGTNSTDSASGEADAQAPAQVVYIAGGMDATYPGDVCTDSAQQGLSYDPLLGTVRDVDFDHDGLQNFQEYLIQSVRHFRYDDLSTPLMGRLITVDTPVMGAVPQHSQEFLGHVPFDTADIDAFMTNIADAWANGVPQAVLDRADPYALMKPWTEEGWRLLGYFAAPVREWDRAVTSAVLADPIYMWPVTSMTVMPEEPSMVTSGTVAGYVTTDPRMADTDGDGMDDYYEMFHGLNPILGTNVDSPDASGWTGGKRGDIISAVNAERNGDDCVATFNAYYNEWIFPAYSSVDGRVSAEPPTEDGTPIAAPQAFDPVLYPWIMGTALVDADGDGMRNDDERIVANAADPMPRHTDPTPLWFTERTTPASYVAQYYVTSQRLMAQSWMPSPSSEFETAAMAGSMNFQYMFGFEEGEGYDTDGDFKFDGAEVVTGFTPATDPLKFEDPDRRQALYLDGVNSCAISRELQERPVQSSDLLKQFTVECWVRPEETGRKQTILERAIVYTGSRITGDAAAVRANFRIGLYSDGRVYGMFDNNDAMESGLNHPVSCQRVEGSELTAGEWAHVALTFDGAELKLYVDGELVKAVKTQLIPANGVTMLAQNPGSADGFPDAGYSSLPAALIVGARPEKASVVAQNSGDPQAALAPYWIDEDTGDHMETFANLREFFKGYVDEVRVWDGARTAAEIKADFRKRYTFKDALENRSAVAYAWIDEATRNNNDAEETLPAELLFHYNFMTLPGAVNAGDVLKVPAGFAAKVIDAATGDYAANPEIDTAGLYANIANLKGADLNVGWWNESLLKSTVYSDYHVVPWIQNTLGHLPLADGNVVDSYLYAKQFGAVYTPAAMHELAMFDFPNSAVPYSSVVYNLDRYMKVFAAARIAEEYGEAFETFQRMSEFAMRSSFSATTDLIPLGGAYAKTCPKMWDRAVADAWELTGADDDADGLPDWWETLVSGGTDISWDTMLEAGDVPAGYADLRKDMFPATAGELFKLDLITGMQPDGTIDEAYKATVDTDGDNLPDWWEKKYGIFASSDVDDDDGDGLSNWAEYLLSEIFEIKVGGKRVRFSPVDAKSVNGHDLDYFIKIGELYAGELFSDHDFIEDLLEDSWGASYSSRYKWDALADADEDGWSNFAEARYNNFTKSIVALYASHIVGDTEIKDMPIPALKLTLRYNGSQPLTSTSEEGGGNNSEDQAATLAPIVVKTYTRTGDKSSVADAKFTIQPGVEQENFAYIGPWEEKTVSGTLTPGYVNAASFDLEYAEVDRNDAYTFFVGDLSTVDAEYAAKWPSGFYVGSYETYMELYSKFGPEMIVLQTSEFAWGNFSDSNMITVTQNSAGDEGYICIMGERAGEINLKSGDFSFDLSSLKWWGAEATNSTSTVSMRQMVLRLKYNSVVPGMQSNKLDLFLGEAEEGFVKEGKNTIVAFYDLDGDGDYTPGEPYGAAAGIDVGWHQAKAEIELTDTSPIFSRIDLTTEMTDRKTQYGLNEGGDIVIDGGGGLSGGKYERIRVVRSFINGAGVSSGTSRIVLDKIINLDQRKYLTEADILESGEFDLDWDHLYDDVIKGVGADVKRVDYMIFYGSSDLSKAAFSSVGISRRFDESASRAVAQAISPGSENSVIFGTHPVFKWKMPGRVNTYTAFKVQILDGTKVVWDSGFRRAPAQDLEGVYTFEADAYIGDELENNKNYTWKVSMYNSKFKTDAWSKENHVFRMNAPTVGAGFANVPVCVKYFGPTNVAAKSEFVVEAFATPDFTGIPAARAVVQNLKSVIEEGATHQTNAFMIGVPAGRYYLRAYADLKGVSGTVKRVRDLTESWGYACKRGTAAADIYSPLMFTVTDANGYADPIDIYIEDVDTNGNCLPDAWEMVKNGGKLDNGASSVDETIANAYAINKVLSGNIQKNVSGPVYTDAYNSYIMTAFSSPAMMALALGYEPGDISIRADGSIAVESEVEEIEITGVGFDASGNVKLTVEGKLNTAEGNTNGLGFLELTGESEKAIECQVLYKETLDQSGWDEVSFPVQITVGSEPQTVTLKIVEDLKGASSGFFKVKVTEQ